MLRRRKKSRENVLDFGQIVSKTLVESVASFAGGTFFYGINHEIWNWEDMI